MAEGTFVVLQCKVPNPTHTGIENWKMCTIKQNKIFTINWDVEPKASAHLSGVPGGPNKPALALGTMIHILYRS